MMTTFRRTAQRAPIPPLALVQHLTMLQVTRRVASAFLLLALIPSSVPWIRFGNPRTLCGLFMCTICRLVRRLFYIKDVLLPCMRLRSLLSGPRIGTKQRLTASEVHENEEAAWAAFHKAQMSSSPGSAKSTRCGNSDTSSEPALFPESATQPAPLPSSTPQETPAKVPPPPQQETQGALVPVEKGDVEVFQNRPVVKVGWRAYLVPRNYSGNHDCDHATCTQQEKCRGGTEEVTHCLDAQNKDFAQRVNANRLTCILLRVFGKWMTEADILELSG